MIKASNILGTESRRASWILCGLTAAPRTLTGSYPSRHVQLPVAGKVSYIAGSDPSLCGHGFGSRRGIRPVPLHERRTAQFDVSRLTILQHMAIIGDYPGLSVGEGRADAGAAA